MTEDIEAESNDDARPKACVLAADIGNTLISLGVVQGEQASALESVALDDLARLRTLVEEMWAAMAKPRRVVACSVNPPALEAFKSLTFDAIDEPVAVVGDDIPLPIPTDLPHPEQIGVDRLCCAAAAYGRLQQACVIVDLGSAITVDCVDGDGVFRGGAILPGMRMQAQALHEGTARLPLVDPAEPAGVFGADTTQAILSGIVAGVRSAVRGLVEGYATELNAWPVVVTTGGDAALFGNPEQIVQTQAPPLCLLGIARALYQSLPEFPQ